MSLGEGILWSTILILLAAGIYLVTSRKKWKLVGKVFAVLVLIGAVIGGGIWGWASYRSRPVVVQELYGVRIGMTPLEIKLTKGKPHIVFPDALTEPTEEQMQSLPWWVIKENPDSRDYLTVGFAKGGESDFYVDEICQRNSILHVLGFAEGDSESEVIDRLGEPSYISISADGLSKYISYERWKVTYEIEKGEVSAICISESGRLAYDPEYGDESDPE